MTVPTVNYETPQEQYDEAAWLCARLDASTVHRPARSRHYRRGRPVRRSLRRPRLIRLLSITAALQWCTRRTPVRRHSRHHDAGPAWTIDAEHARLRRRASQPRIVTDIQIRNARRLIEGGGPAAQVARDLQMSRATFYRRSRSLGPFPETSDEETPENDGIT